MAEENSRGKEITVSNIITRRRGTMKTYKWTVLVVTGMFLTTSPVKDL